MDCTSIRASVPLNMGYPYRKKTTTLTWITYEHTNNYITYCKVVHFFTRKSCYGNQHFVGYKNIQAYCLV